MKTPKYIIKLVDFLWANKKRLLIEDDGLRYSDFEPPTLGGLPREMHRYISEDMICWVGDNIPFSGWSKPQLLSGALRLRDKGYYDS